MFPFNLMMDEINNNNDIKDKIDIDKLFGPYSKLLTKQKNVIIAARSGSETFMKRGQNILRYSVLKFNDRIVTIFYFYHDTIGSLLEETFYDNITDGINSFEEMKDDFPEISTAIYGEGLVIETEKEQCFEILEELLGTKTRYTYATRTVPSVCPYITTSSITSYSEA